MNGARIFALILMTLAAMALPQRSLAQDVTVTDTSPPEAKLASIDARTKVVAQKVIRNYGRRLDSVDKKCKENRVAIADITVKGVELLREKRVTMSLLKFLESMDDAMPEGSESLGLSCAEIGAMLVTMIERP